MINKEMKITTTRGAENPFRKGSARAKRASVVLRANGKPVAEAIRRGARLSTVAYLAKARVIRLHK